MSRPAEYSRRNILPAELDFLAIYNPSLGTTDDTLENQIVYYSSPKSGGTENPLGPATLESKAAIHERRNEQLRQIGLAQGIVSFGRNFSGGKSVDVIDTRRSRIILHELESGWWILTSINLTILPGAESSAGLESASSVAKEEYSSREMKPATLLLADLLRAHAIFLLHHASSLSALFVRTRRSKFIGILERYWDTFLSTWSVLLHGNPANNMYGGIKLAACGELGIGVGEEERGSGERAVLEGFVGRIDGLVDVIVSRFGNPEPDDAEVNTASGGRSLAKYQVPWLGSGNDPASEDGTVFLGTGALSRKSLRDVSHWMEDLYRWGSQAYGVVDNPSSNRRSKKSKDVLVGSKVHRSDDGSSHHDRTHDTGRQKLTYQPKSTVTILPESLDGEQKHILKQKQQVPTFHNDLPGNMRAESEPAKTNRLVNYLKLGYGTHWSLGSISTEDEEHRFPKRVDILDATASKGDVPPSVQAEHLSIHDPSLHSHYYTRGKFLIGLMGNIEDADPEVGKFSQRRQPQSTKADGLNTRLLLRTITVELEREVDARAETEISIDLGIADNDRVSSKNAGSEHTGTSNTSFESQDRNKTKKLRVVVYVNRPFMFVLLFELRADSLALTKLYRSLHDQIKVLIKPLLTSTAFRLPKPEADIDGGESPIYDLIWDPKLLTIASTIPNIPDPAQVQRRLTHPWFRIEALSTHLQIINTYIATTKHPVEMECTCKTSRGWWVVWTRIPDVAPTATKVIAKTAIPDDHTGDSADTQRSSEPTLSRGTSTLGSSLVSAQAHPFLDNVNPYQEHVSRDKEIFLVRRAREHATSQNTGRFALASLGREDVNSTDGPPHGIGVDTRRYIKALLSL